MNLLRNPSLVLLAGVVLASAAAPARAAPTAPPRGFAWRDTIQQRYDRRQFAAAESLATLAIEEAAADSGHATLSVGRLSRMLGLSRWRQQGSTLDSARAPLARALGIFRDRLGGPTHELGDLIASDAVVLAGHSHWNEAVDRAREGVRTTEASADFSDTLLIRPLTVLAVILSRAGRTEEAVPHYERAADLHERARPPRPDAAADLRADAGLAALQAGDLERADSLLTRAETSLASRLPESHPLRVRAAEHRLALMRRHGDLPGQRALLDRLIAVDRAGGEPAALAVRLRSRAHVRSQMADDAGALADLTAAAGPIERRFGLAHTTTISVLSELAQFQDIAGSHALAESTFARALHAASAFEPVPAKSTALVHASRAARAYARRELVAARDGFERAARIHASAQGPNALDVGVTLLELSRVLADLRLADSASTVLASARAVFRRHRSPLHPDFADADAQEALAHASAGDRERAWDLALSSAHAGVRHLRLVARGSTEREALRLAEQRRYRLGLAQALACEQQGAGAPRARERLAATWERTIEARSLVLDAVAERRHRRGLAWDAERAAIDREWDRASGAYARLLVALPSEQDSASRAELAAARAALEAAERAWAQATGMRASADSDTGAVLPLLAARLQPGQALVGFARHTEVAGRPARYLAFVLRAGERAPALVPLAHADSIQARADAWRAALDLRRALDAASLRALEAEAERTGSALRQAVWDPLGLASVREVFVVPDGALQLVNLAALPDGRGGHLVESGPTFITLGSERDLLPVPARTPNRAPAGLLAMGAPDFDARGGASETPIAAAGFRGGTESCPRFRDLRFPSLAAAGGEVRDIAAAAGGRADVRVGAAADEATFKHEAPRHRHLHVATHGFYLAEGCAGESGALRGIGGLAPADTTRSRATEPLRLSGLALAGANRRAEAGPGAEDGILTAEEIAALDLTAVERVVLSACRSGVGDVITGEGVTGLRRAFRAAGAGTLVMSLWDIDDRASADWMRSFYAALADGRSVSGAVRGTSRAELERRRASGDSTHPAYWGAFVAVGRER